MNQESAKKSFWTLLNIFLAVASVFVVFFMMPLVKSWKESVYPVRSISVGAEGKTFVSPDVAEIPISVVSRGKNPEDLAETNTEKMNAVIKFLKGEKVEDKDIKTTQYNLSPEYQWDQTIQRNYITGYVLTQTVNVKVRDLANVAKILGGLTPLGVNQIGGVTFTIDDTDKALAVAREEAFKKAQEKAKQMAEVNGLRLGRITNVSESPNFYPPMPYYARSEAAMGMGGDMVKSIAPQIEPGTEQISVQVSITYELR